MEKIIWGTKTRSGAVSQNRAKIILLRQYSAPTVSSELFHRERYFLWENPHSDLAITTRILRVVFFLWSWSRSVIRSNPWWLRIFHSFLSKQLSRKRQYFNSENSLRSLQRSSISLGSRDFQWWRIWNTTLVSDGSWGRVPYEELHTDLWMFSLVRSFGCFGCFLQN